jgi:hypothetical protein
VRARASHPPRRSARLVAAALALSLASCTGFPRGWSAAKRTPPPDPVSGAWIGTWKSDVNGHHGGLRCVAARTDAQTWHFRYRASWAKVLCAGFSMNAAVKPLGRDSFRVTGSRDLGKLFGGVFSCNGTVSGDRFSARYDSVHDRGSMELRRPRGSESRHPAP